MTTDQLKLWQSDFGKDYASRDSNSVSYENQRRLMLDWAKILNHIPSSLPNSAIEIGCNIGRNLVALRNFIPQLTGIEPNAEVCKAARSSPGLAGVDILEGDCFKIPFGDAHFDMSFTSGVLIHVAPEDLGRAVDEIYRVSKNYVLCIEYFSRNPVSIEYRGRNGYLFKRDFGRFYLELFPDLKVAGYGFIWEPVGSGDDLNWWLFAKNLR